MVFNGGRSAAAAIAGVVAAASCYAVYKKQSFSSLNLIKAIYWQQRPVIIVLDIGSSSIRCSAFVSTPADINSPWTVIPSSLHTCVKSAINNEEYGTANANDILSRVDKLVTKTLSTLRQSFGIKSVSAVGISCFAMTLVGINSTGNAVTPVYTYADSHPDTAASASTLYSYFKSRGMLESLTNRTGTAFYHPSYAPATLHRIQATENSIKRWQSLSSFILSKWTGATSGLPVSYSDASWTGLFDFRNLKWDGTLMKVLKIAPEVLPPVVDSSTEFTSGELADSYKRRWKALGRAKLFYGTSDGAAANIGSKCVDETSVAVTVGTSAAVRVVLPVESMMHAEHRVPRGLWCYRITKDRVLLGGALTDGGSIHEYISRLVRYDGDNTSTNTAPDSHGLTILPFLSRERSINWSVSSKSKFTITGMTFETKPGHIVRAGLEAVGLQLAEIFSRLTGVLDSVENVRVLASGGALEASSLWRQIIADCLGHDVLFEKGCAEATSRGIVWLMSKRVLLLSGDDDAIVVENTSLSIDAVHVSSYCTEAHSVYLAAKSRQERLYDQLVQFQK